MSRFGFGYVLNLGLLCKIVFFAGDTDLNERVDDGPPDTTLTAWFETNKSNYVLADGTPARTLLYADFPRYFTWKANGKAWSERKAGYAIGRMHSVHPNDRNRFYLRLLLSHVRGATSFEDIRTVTRNGRTVTYDTFREAALALGLLVDDNCWRQTLAEAASSQTGAQLRRLFASLLIFGEMHEPGMLFEAFFNVSFLLALCSLDTTACRI